MTLFEKYLKPIELSGDPKPLPYEAYHLDGSYPKPDLRRDAAAGSCNCCDYFFFSSENLILIEDTRLVADINRKEQKYKYLNSDDLNSHVQKLVCLENVLKVYGSLFVLYRFISRCPDLNLIPKIESIQFWFVINDANREDTRIFDRFKDPLNQAISGKLGRKVVNKVEVMTRSNFIERFKSASSCGTV